MRNQASPELRVLQKRNMWGQSYALESSRISECYGIREPRQGKGIALKPGHCRHFLLWHQLIVET
jgi:hypothetical protein